ncbi:MAG: hypothetical protein ACT6TB_21535 [Sphingopyxis sp.]
MNLTIAIAAMSAFNRLSVPFRLPVVAVSRLSASGLRMKEADIEIR